MKVSSAQAVGIGALFGGVAAIGTSMALRYWADDLGTTPGAGQPVSYTIWWEHAPLVGILGGVAATILSYYLFDHSTEAAVACGMTALVAGVAPEADAWITETRAAADLKAAAAGTTTSGTHAGVRGPHGMADVVDLQARMAALEAAFREQRAAA